MYLDLGGGMGGGGGDRGRRDQEHQGGAQCEGGTAKQCHRGIVLCREGAPGVSARPVCHVLPHPFRTSHRLVGERDRHLLVRGDPHSSIECFPRLGQSPSTRLGVLRVLAVQPGAIGHIHT